MLVPGATAMRYVAVAALLALALAACGEATEQHTPASTPTARLDQRLEDAAARATAEADAPRFNREILGLYIAPSIDDWPADLREEHARTIAGGCVDEPAGQSELDLMSPLNLPPGFEPDGYLAAGAKPQVVACSGRTTGLTFEYRKMNDDGTPASITLMRSVARAWDFDAAVEAVSARTIGGRQAVAIAPRVADAPAQRSMVLFPEDFGATVVHAFNLPEPDLLAFAEMVASASAPYWEAIPSGLSSGAARVCAAIPTGATSDHAAFGFTDDERTSEMTFSYFDGASNTSYSLLLYPGDALDDCSAYIRQTLAFGRDPALYDGARGWLATHGGELAGECATRPLIIGRDDTLADWCYYRPRYDTGDVILTIQRGQSDFTIPLVLRLRDGGYDVVDATQPETDKLRIWYFRDDHSFRWSRYSAGTGYRLTAKLIASRESAPDPCAEPPLTEDTREILLDETFPGDVDTFALDLPDLPPEDAWYVAIRGINADVRLEALDPNGEVIAETGTAWVRDLFCPKPQR